MTQYGGTLARFARLLLPRKCRPKMNPGPEPENLSCMCCCTCREDELRSQIHNHDMALSDDHFRWLSPDRTVDLPFCRSPAAALEVASTHDICISGDGLTHLHRIGADPVYVPLAQVCILLSSLLTPLCCNQQLGGMNGRHPVFTLLPVEAGRSFEAYAGHKPE